MSVLNLPLCAVLFFCGGDSSTEVTPGDRRRSEALLGRHLVDREFQRQRIQDLKKKKKSKISHM